MYSYKIVAVLAFRLSLLLFKQLHVYCFWPPHYYTLGVHVYCFWPLLRLELLLFKQIHMYCLWPPHYYTLGVHVYCLWPLLFVCPFTINRNCSTGCTTQEECHHRRNHSDWRRPPNDCLSLEAGTNFFLHVLFVATPMSTISVYYCSTCTVCGHPTMSNYFTMYYYTHYE